MKKFDLTMVLLIIFMLAVIDYMYVVCLIANKGNIEYLLVPILAINVPMIFIIWMIIND